MKKTLSPWWLCADVTMATCIIRKMWTHALMVEVVLDPFTLFWKCLIIFMITGCSSLPSPFTHRFDQQLPEFLHDTSLLSVPQFLAKCYVKWICKNSDTDFFFFLPWFLLSCPHRHPWRRAPKVTMSILSTWENICVEQSQKVSDFRTIKRYLIYGIDIR